MKKLRVLFFVFLVIFLVDLHVASAQGMFGPPQGYAREGKGLYTGFGYLNVRDKYKQDRLMTQEAIYSEAGYGLGKGFEIFGRVGFVTNGALSRSLGSNPACMSLSDLHTDDRVLGTMGARWFQAINNYVGWGSSPKEAITSIMPMTAYGPPVTEGHPPP